MRAQGPELVPVVPAPERVLAQAQAQEPAGPAGQVRELARAPVHRLAAPVPGLARELVLAPAAQVPGLVPAQVRGRALLAHPPAPVQGPALERAPEAELAAGALAVLAAPGPRVVQAVQQARLVVHRAVVPERLLPAMVAPAVWPRREARREPAASRVFGDAFSVASRTVRQCRQLTQQVRSGLRQMGCTR